MANDMQILKLIEAGIRAESVRQRAIAANLANMNSPDYRRSDIKFEEILTKAIKSGGTIEPEDLEPVVRQPHNTPVNANGNDVSLDVEVGEMVKNSLRHKTYMSVLRKKYQQMESAIKV
jgi:flagellar basal-body rod protein FlgB